MECINILLIYCLLDLNLESCKSLKVNIIHIKVKKNYMNEIIQE